MKKILIILSAVLLMALPKDVCGQAKLTTRSFKLADFSTRTTRIVLTGDPVTDEILRGEVSRRWRVSPYEFCSASEFEASRQTVGYYYLAMLQEYMGKDQRPGICYLTLLKGGKDKTSVPEEKGFEVVNFPFSNGESVNGTELLLLPAALDIIQKYVTDAVSSDATAYGGLVGEAINPFEKKPKTILIDAGDLADGVEGSFEGHLIITDHDGIVESLSDGDQDTVISYVVTTQDRKIGDPCYRMLISTDTHRLYYFRKHRLSVKEGAGFLRKDIEFLTKEGR